MSRITITEGLAEIKTIDKRVAKKRDFILSYLYRQEKIKDPHVAAGGSAQVIEQERQSIHDLEERKIAIRRAIQAANARTEVTVCGQVRNIADWLVWRRDVAPSLQQFYGSVRNKIEAVRNEALRQGVVMVAADAAARPNDVVVNMDETRIAAQIDELEETLGTLDGALSLKNATTFIDA